MVRDPYETENTNPTGWAVLRANTIDDYMRPKEQQPIMQQPQVQEQPQQSDYQKIINALPSSKYLGDDYKMDKWLKDDEASGVTNPLVRMMRYNTMVAPFVQQAKEDKIREAIRIASNPQYRGTPAYTEALVELSTLNGDPDYGDKLNWEREKRGYEKDKYEALAANGYVGGGRRGSTGNPVGRPRSGDGNPKTTNDFAKLVGLGGDEVIGNAFEKAKWYADNPKEDPKEQKEVLQKSQDAAAEELSNMYEDLIRQGYHPQVARQIIRGVAQKEGYKGSFVSNILDLVHQKVSSRNRAFVEEDSNGGNWTGEDVSGGGIEAARLAGMNADGSRNGALINKDYAYDPNDPDAYAYYDPLRPNLENSLVDLFERFRVQGNDPSLVYNGNR